MVVVLHAPLQVAEGDGNEAVSGIPGEPYGSFLRAQEIGCNEPATPDAICFQVADDPYVENALAKQFSS